MIKFNYYLSKTVPPKAMPMLDVKDPIYNVITYAIDKTFPSDIDYTTKITIIIKHSDIDVLNELNNLIRSNMTAKDTSRVTCGDSDVSSHLLVKYVLDRNQLMENKENLLIHIDKCVRSINNDIHTFNTTIIPIYIEKYETVSNMLKD